MQLRNLDLTVVPEPRRAGIEQLAEQLVELALDELLAITAFGGWRLGDPAYAGAPSRTVVVLREANLLLLERLADRGPQLGAANITAPLIMTPDYIRDSCDVFPLEFLEIQHTGAPLCGPDHFAELQFQPDDVRLACERELKSELIQLRQGLLAAAGNSALIQRLCQAGSERAIRILRGILHLRDVTPPPKTAAAIARAAATQTGLTLELLPRFLEDPADKGREGLRQLYRELAALTAYVDTYGA